MVLRAHRTRADGHAGTKRCVAVLVLASGDCCRFRMRRIPLHHNCLSSEPGRQRSFWMSLFAIAEATRFATFSNPS